MIVISGCPRSGTSLLMDCMRHTFGDDRIMGAKFPQEKNLQDKQYENEDDNAFETRMHLSSIFNKDKIEKAQKDFELIKDMNPNGFWECRYSVAGIKWHIGFKDNPKTIVKVVSQGLPQTDPRYVDKMIYMLREPHQVAKSQERLRRMPFMDIEEERDMQEKMKICRNDARTREFNFNMRGLCGTSVSKLCFKLISFIFYSKNNFRKETQLGTAAPRNSFYQYI